MAGTTQRIRLNGSWRFAAWPSRSTLASPGLHRFCLLVAVEAQSRQVEAWFAPCNGSSAHPYCPLFSTSSAQAVRGLSIQYSLPQ
jgi:hypothetical protein